MDRSIFRTMNGVQLSNFEGAMTILKIFITVLFGISIQYCYAGTAVSGGGAAIVCRNANHDILSAQLYDLSEGRNNYQLNIADSDVNPHLQLVAAIDRLHSWPYAQSYLKFEAREVIRDIRFISGGHILQAPSDLGSDEPIIIPRGCALEGVGFYKGSGILLVSLDVFNKFSATDKAAFILHETLYKVARKNGERNSVNSRHFNALLFASNSTSDDFQLLTSTLRLNLQDVIVVNAATPHTDFQLNVHFDDVFNPGRTSQIGSACFENYEFADQPLVPSRLQPGPLFVGSIHFSMTNKPCMVIGVGAVEINPISGPAKPLMNIRLSLVSGPLLTEKTVNDWEGFSAREVFVLAYPNLSIPAIPGTKFIAPNKQISYF